MNEDEVMVLVPLSDIHEVYKGWQGLYKLLDQYVDLSDVQFLSKLEPVTAPMYFITHKRYKTLDGTPRPELFEESEQ